MVIYLLLIKGFCVFKSFFVDKRVSFAMESVISHDNVTLLMFDEILSDHIVNSHGFLKIYVVYNFVKTK